MYEYFNPNPLQKKVGDCVIRAISKLTGQDWDTTYMDIILYGYMLKDMPSSNAVWDAYLIDKGYQKYAVPNTCPVCYTVRDFCADHPKGLYLLAIGTHVVCAEDGKYCDTWDSGDEVVMYFYTKEEINNGVQ